MIQFSKLRLHGFKSFCEKTELDIGPGLTGIVGPNGCGKSNLVEALRWSMGESSTKRMRGGSRSMDDMIFNGTAKRPARNTAEVSILLDNTSHSAPAPYTKIEEIEVVRKIERDHGSGYRINGKNVRARDVQLLYADMLAGANSPYLVSQGKVANMIQAKPSERRMILEEAAGITGLYARRHEAELRLRATDNNLKRMDDLLGSMEGRLNDLKKQARQANRYRNLSAQIRQLEISIACLEYRTAFEKLNDVKSRYGEVESRVAEHMVVVNQLTKTQTEQSKDMPDLRQKDAEMGAALQTHNLALQRLEDEQARLSEELETTKSQLSQIITDRNHEKQSLTENTAALERLTAEEETLRSKEKNQNDDLSDKEKVRDELKEIVGKLEERLNALVQDAAEVRARKQSLERQVEQDEASKERLSARLQDAEEQLKTTKEDMKSAVDTEGLRKIIAKAEKQLEDIVAKIEKGETEKQVLQDKQREISESLTEKSKELSKIDTEISMLESILNADSDLEFKPVFDDVKAEQGFEIALSRALGDSLMGSIAEDAPVVWKKREFKDSDIPALPAGAQKLEPHVKAPEALKFALNLIGFVEDVAAGDKLAQELKPGQSLVSREGAYWRWDGLFIKATAQDSNAQRLKHKNQLAELQKQRPALEKALEKLESSKQDVADKLQTHEETLRATRLEKIEQDDLIKKTQSELNAAIESQAGAQAEVAKIEETISLAKADLASLEIRLGDTKLALADFNDESIEAQQVKTEELKVELATEREKLQDAINTLEMARQDHNRRQARLQAIGDERVNLQNRCIRAQERLKDLDTRETQLSEKSESLKKRPAEIKVEKETLLSKIANLESEKAIVSDKLQICENELGETTTALKEAEAKLATAREQRASAQATAEERHQQMESTKRYIREHFDLSPEELMREAAMDPENLPELGKLKAEREQAIRSRDIIGAVNLRAEQEATDLEKELGGILNEKQDLVEAIEELRGGINKLNAEARERLQAAFDHVNGYFREMFTRLFHGGKAHLALIESDDPLEAGLEIFAQPPGKALQSLTLLSGGEQTLTAIALIFAMFLTNPAPICVLDEVDAPLDDANVDRFCDLLEEFADRGETRFLVITHHRLTMARMDRLYGVTMAERGVSKLVSVDLNQQFDFLDAVA